MKAALPEADVARFGVQQVDIGQLNLGPVAVGSLVLDAMHLDVSTGAAQLVNLRVTVTLAFALDWKVTVSIPLVHTWTWDGTIDLGSHTVSVTLGDVDLPGLQALSVDLDTVTIDDLDAVIGPVSTLQLGPLAAEQIAARDVVAPVPDFQLTGIGLGSATVSGLAVPAASVASAKIGRLSGQAFPLGSVTLSNLTLPQANLGDLASTDVDVDATSNPFNFHADAGVLDVTLRVTPGVRTQMDQFRLGNVRSSGSVGSVELKDVVLPYEVLDLTLSQIGIDSISVPTIEVS